MEYVPPEDDQRAGTSARIPSSASILVVEDEHVVALDLQVRLGRMGHTVMVAHSGEEAVEQVLRHHFDLVLMDIKLHGELDGIEAARAIRRGLDIPVIYVTAYADNHTLDRARYTEPYGYILKPFQDRELRAAIEIALQRHARDAEQFEQQRLQHFLADASSQMLASLDFQAIAGTMANLLVPRYADWCLIHLREHDDTVPGYAYAQPPSVGEGASAPVIEAVEQHARSELFTQLADPLALRDTVGAQHVDALRELGARSLMCVPLVARRQVLGALALVSGRLRPRYGASDLAFVEDFAQRLAIALDNALLYRKAERAIRMRDDVLAIVSHDLKTPLSTIMLHADALARDGGVEELGRSIARSAERIHRLIGDLVDASAINAEQLSLDLQACRTDDLVREAVEAFRSQAQLRELALEAKVDDSTRVRCDHDRIIQVLSNLIDNALRFTPRRGRVTVSAVRRGGEVRFAVSDTGRGIAPDVLPHLFDRFWRVQAPRAGTGTGLGLYIAKGILASHGSSLAVESELGVGSTFSFDLPVEE
jgi:signal transduction histidine kinase/CheY-like chemotaxis protein